MLQMKAGIFMWEHIPDMSNGSGKIVSSQQVILVLLLDGILKAKMLRDSTVV
jgi:hypothetical protein